MVTPCWKQSKVLFVPHPPLREGATLRVMKLHKHQSDALVGEATISQPKGGMVLKLMRRGAPQGVAMVTVTTGLPTMKPKAEVQAEVPAAVPTLSVDSIGSPGEESIKSGKSHNSSVANALAPRSPERPASTTSAQRPSRPLSPSSGSSPPPIPDERTPEPVPPKQAQVVAPAGEQVDIFSHLLACSSGILKGAAELCSSKEESGRR
eukprot:s1548_g4.t1